MIRILTENDVEAFRNLRLETLSKDPQSWYSKYEVEKDFPLYEFTNRLTYSRSPIFGYYGYFEDNKLLGYIQISANYWTKKKHVAIISDVCVSSSARNKGIGTELMKYVVDKMKTVPGIEQIELWVNSLNPQAINFYEKLGFKKIAEIQNSLKEDGGTYQNEFIYILPL